MAASVRVSPEAGASAIHTFLTVSAVCNHACWRAVTKLYFSLICSCRVFQARERICWRTVFHMHFSKVFHGAFYKNKQSNSLPVCVILLYSCLKNISFRYQPVWVWVYIFRPMHIQNENSPKLIMVFFFFGVGGARCEHVGKCELFNWWVEKLMNTGIWLFSLEFMFS